MEKLLAGCTSLKEKHVENDFVEVSQENEIQRQQEKKTSQINDNLLAKKLPQVNICNLFICIMIQFTFKFSEITHCIKREKSNQ